MELFFNEEKVRKVMFFLLFFFACAQNLSFFTISDVAYASLSLKPVHVFSLLFLPILLKQERLVVNKLVLLFVGYALLISAVHAQSFGIRGLNALYIFGLYILVILQNCGRKFTCEEWANLFCKVAVIILVMILIKDVIQKDGIIWYLQTPGKEHPWITTILGGHVNLESTWLGLFAFFFYKNRWKWLYAGINLAISILYGSRCGMIVAGLAIIWLLLPELERLKERKVRIAVGVILLIGFGVLVWSGIFENVILRAVARFFSGGADNGDRTRLAMWKYIGQASLRYPLGCGVGNSILALEKVSGQMPGDSNLHNVYFQELVDLGWLGGAAYLFLTLRLFWRGRKELLTNPFLASLAAYSIVALFQFRGGETLAFIVLGIYLTLRDEGDSKSNLTIRNPMHRTKGEIV